MTQAAHFRANCRPSAWPLYVVADRAKVTCKHCLRRIERIRASEDATVAALRAAINDRPNQAVAPVHNGGGE